MAWLSQLINRQEQHQWVKSECRGKKGFAGFQQEDGGDTV